MARIQKQFSFESDEQYQRFLDLASRYQIVHQGNPSASGLAQAIADKVLWIFDPSETNPKDSEIDVLMKALWLIRDIGGADICLKLIDILTRYQLPLPLLQEIIRIQISLRVMWIEKLQLLINQQQPFTISYRKSNGGQKAYTVVYAEFLYIERHRYLAAKILTNESSDSFPELAANRSFRLDRLQDVEIAPNTGITWQPGLATILAKFVLLGDWARSYEAKPEDVSVDFDSWQDGDYCKIITRRIWNWFFFQRDIMRYGSKCIVLEPLNGRELVKAEIEKLMANYDDLTI